MGMSKLQCPHNGCFYWANGKCTSISAISTADCAQYRSKEQPRFHALPQPGILSQIRKNMISHEWVHREDVHANPQG